MKTKIRNRPPLTPTLRFSPTAWAKLQLLCHHGETEIGGFGVAETEDPLLVTEFVTVKQRASPVSVEFDDQAVADFFDRQVDQGLRPEQFARTWLHTHPGNSPHPSGTDEATFARVFGRCDWALMFILARGGETYARLRFQAGPGASIVIPAGVDYTQQFEESDHDAWIDEYERNVQPEAFKNFEPMTDADFKLLAFEEDEVWACR